MTAIAVTGTAGRSWRVRGVLARAGGVSQRLLVGDFSRAPPLAGSDAVRAENGEAEAVAASPTGVDSLLTVSASETLQGRRYDELLIMGVVWRVGHPMCKRPTVGRVGYRPARPAPTPIRAPDGLPPLSLPCWRTWMPWPTLVVTAFGSNTITLVGSRRVP